MAQEVPLSSVCMCWGEGSADRASYSEELSHLFHTEKSGLFGTPARQQSLE